MIIRRGDVLTYTQGTRWPHRLIVTLTDPVILLTEIDSKELYQMDGRKLYKRQPNQLRWDEVDYDSLTVIPPMGNSIYYIVSARSERNVERGKVIYQSDNLVIFRGTQNQIMKGLRDSKQVYLLDSICNWERINAKLA